MYQTNWPSNGTIYIIELKLGLFNIIFYILRESLQ